MTSLDSSSQSGSRLALQGKVQNSLLTVWWEPPSSYNHFSLRIDRCDDSVACTTVKSAELDFNSSLSHFDPVASRCTVYNVHITAESSKNNHQPISDETYISNKTTGCFISEQLVLSIGLPLLGVLLLGCVLLLCYYRRQSPFNISRVRSRVYSRLYSQERYQLPVRTTQLNQIIQENMRDDDPFSGEFQRLERLACDTIQRRTEIAELPANRRRNRYKDIVPFDANRVPVQPYKVDGDREASDYINASFIPDQLTGYPRKYIAAQGPGEETSPAFWSMVWQYQVRVVVMLTNLVEGCGFPSLKCALYWPDKVGDCRRFGDLEVQLFDCAEAPHYVVRKLDVSHKKEGTSRVVIHIQFTSWRDRGVPVEPAHLVQLVQLTRVLGSQPSEDRGVREPPLLVHCSAGVGRTGTFICMDQLMRAVEAGGKVETGSGQLIDIFYTVYQLRRQRRYLVQTRAQYEYVYRCCQAFLEGRMKKLSLTGGSPA